jgi:hypothetical protein
VSHSASAYEKPKGTAIDSGIFTTYSAASDGASVSYVVCGSTKESEGCFGNGSLGPFEQACAVMEGTPPIARNVVTRAIYVLDKRTKKGQPVQLYVYTRTDKITAGDDTITVTPTQQVSLEITGGFASKCSMAANSAFVYAGTTASSGAAVIDKTAFTVTYGGAGGNLVSITADDQGYVALHFDNGFYVVAPDGGTEEDGGGPADLANASNAWLPILMSH